MGWEDGHMHEFRIGQRRLGRPEPADPFMRTPSRERERTERLSAVLGRTSAKMIYTDDLSDSWEHGIVLEKQPLAVPNTPYPVCMDDRSLALWFCVEKKGVVIACLHVIRRKC